jgi:hypothetical protein
LQVFPKKNNKENKMKTTNPKENQMKATSKMTKSVVFAAILACLIVAEAGSAFATNLKTTQVFRSLSSTTLTGKCCFLWGEFVTVIEPAAVAPVTLTWSADYAIHVTDLYLVGLSVNNGPCSTLLYGSRALQDYNTVDSDGYASASFQWVVLPSDGLEKGTNTFELCGGGENSASDSVTLGNNTLVVRIGN